MSGFIERLARLARSRREGSRKARPEELAEDGTGLSAGPDSPEARAERTEMIKGVEELGTTTVKEVLVPRTDTVFLPLDIDRKELLEKVSSCGHSRIPVYRDGIDDIAGILYAKDLLRALVRGGDFSLAELVRKPFFVPETKRIDSLLREFRRRRVHIAVAVDEYGGVSGIVCLEDIIEEIVGEIQDEFDEEGETLVALGPDAWLCDARADLDDLNERLDLGLPADDFDSLGGYVLDLFGRIPLAEERTEAEGLGFTVAGLDGHRITQVRIERIGPPKEAES